METRTFPMLSAEEMFEVFLMQNCYGLDQLDNLNRSKKLY